MKSSIVFLVGMPASGKSTYVRTMNFDAVVVSSDSIIDDYAKSLGKTYDEVFSDYVGIADKEFKRQFDEAVANGKNIIVDRTNLSVKSRGAILSRIPKDARKNYSIEAMVFEIPESIRNIRMDKRKVAEGKSIPKHVLASMQASYVPPSKSEGFDLVKYFQ